MSGSVLAAILIAVGIAILLIRPIVSLLTRRRRVTPGARKGRPPTDARPPFGSGDFTAPGSARSGGYGDVPMAPAYVPAPAPRGAPAATLPAAKAAPSDRSRPAWLTVDRAIAFGSLVVGVVALFKK